MGLLRADELARIAGTANQFLPTPCALSRGGVPLSPQPAMPDGTPLRCRVAADSTELRTEGAPREFEQRRWRVTFPDGTDVRVGDSLVALGITYAIVEVASPTSYSVSANAYAYILLDAAGNAPYIVPTARITTHRTQNGRPMAPLADLPVQIEYARAGAVTVLGELEKDRLIAPFGTDLAINDVVTVTAIRGPRGWAPPPRPLVFKITECDDVGGLLGYAQAALDKVGQ